MSVTEHLLDNNTCYAESFSKGHLPMPPGLKVTVVAWTPGSMSTGSSARGRAMLL